MEPGYLGSLYQLRKLAAEPTVDPLTEHQRSEREYGRLPVHEPTQGEAWRWAGRGAKERLWDPWAEPVGEWGQEVRKEMDTWEAPDFRSFLPDVPSDWQDRAEDWVSDTAGEAWRQIQRPGRYLGEKGYELGHELSQLSDEDVAEAIKDSWDSTTGKLKRGLGRSWTRAKELYHDATTPARSLGEKGYELGRDLSQLSDEDMAQGFKDVYGDKWERLKKDLGASWEAAKSLPGAPIRGGQELVRWGLDKTIGKNQRHRRFLEAWETKQRIARQKAQQEKIQAFEKEYGVPYQHGVPYSRQVAAQWRKRQDQASRDWVMGKKQRREQQMAAHQKGVEEAVARHMANEPQRLAAQQAATQKQIAQERAAQKAYMGRHGDQTVKQVYQAPKQVGGGFGSRAADLRSRIKGTQSAFKQSPNVRRIADVSKQYGAPKTAEETPTNHGMRMYQRLKPTPKQVFRMALRGIKPKSKD